MRKAIFLKRRLPQNAERRFFKKVDFRKMRKAIF